MKIILFRGQKRSGNHLVINWIQPYYNNPFFHNDYFSDKPFTQQSGDFLLANLNKAKQAGHDMALFSFEFPLVISDQFAYVKSRAPCYTPFIIRDPLNWISSYATKHKTREEARVVLIEQKELLWNIWLETYKIWKLSCFQINYNRFVRNIDYRKELATRLHKDFDSAKDAVVMNSLWQSPQVSHPSSFDTETVSNGTMEAKDMKVLERYKEMLDGIEIPSEILQCAKEIDPDI